MAVSTLPYVYTWLVAPEGMRFIGWLGAPADHNAYLAWIKQATEGLFLFKGQFTTEPHARAFVRPLWLLLGKASAVSGASALALYHIARAVLGVAALVCVYFFISMFVKSTTIRKTAFLLVCTSAGVGWVFALRSYLTGAELAYSLDLYSPEAITFRSIHYHVHFSLAIALMLLIFMLMLVSFRRSSLGYSALAGLTGFVLAFEHPYDMLTVYTAMALFTVMLALRDREFPITRIKLLLPMFFISALPFAYNLYFLMTDPVFGGWAAQNVVPSPPLPGVLWGYGLLVPFSLIGMYVCVRRKKDTDLLLLGWMAAVGFLIYSPFSFQLKFIQGVHVAVSITAAFGIFSVSKSLRGGLRGINFGIGLQAARFKRFRLVALTVLVILMSLTNFATLANDMFFHRHADPFPTYLHQDYFEGFKWLDVNTAPGDTVLSSYIMGNFIPGWAGNRVFIGHWSETLNFAEKAAILKKFFASWDDEKRRAMLREHGIRYLFFNREGNPGVGGFDPFESSLFRMVFSNASLAIFEVRGL